MRIYAIILLIFFTRLTFGQNIYDSKVDFIRVYKSVYCPMVPFADIQTEISNNQIFHRIILPPRRKMKSEQLAVYDSWVEKPKYQAMEKSDFDSIVNFVMTSGILNLDINYSKPVAINGLFMMKTGGCFENYVFETSLGTIELPIRNSNDFELPAILKEFDVLFQRIVKKYGIKDD